MIKCHDQASCNDQASRSNIMIKHHDQASWSSIMIKRHDKALWSSVMIKRHDQTSWSNKVMIQCTGLNILWFSFCSASLSEWSALDRSSVWLEVPISRSSVISEAAKFGFRFHHAEGSSSVLCLWLRKNMQSKIPLFASHQVGVAGNCLISVEFWSE